MPWFKGILNFYLESSIHVSLAVCSFTLMSFWTFQIEVDWALIGFIFCGSITGYNFVKYAPFAGFHHRSLTRHVRAIQLFSLAVFFLFLYFLFQMPGQIQLWSMALGIPTLLYAIPFFKNKSLRSFSGMKIFVVALVWSGVTVIIPWVLAREIRTEVWITVFQRFLWVLALIMPFEIRDLVYDSPELGTIPQRIGIKNTRKLGKVFLWVIALTEFFKNELNYLEIGVLLIMLVITGVFVHYAEKNQSRYYTAFWVESIPILGVMLMGMAKCYFFNS